MFVTVESVEEAFVLIRRAWSLHRHEEVCARVSHASARTLQSKHSLVLDVVVLDDDPGDSDIGVDGALFVREAKFRKAAWLEAVAHVQQRYRGRRCRCYSGKRYCCPC